MRSAISGYQTDFSNPPKLMIAIEEQYSKLVRLEMHSSVRHYGHIMNTPCINTVHTTHVNSDVDADAPDSLSPTVARKGTHERETGTSSSCMQIRTRTKRARQNEEHRAIVKQSKYTRGSLTACQSERARQTKEGKSE